MSKRKTDIALEVAKETNTPVVMIGEKKKPILQCTEEITRKVDYYTLDQYIKDATGHDYDCVGSEEWGNDSQHRFNVRPITADYETKEWKKFKKSGTKGGFMLRVILDGLCTDGFISAGVYLVTVCW